MEFATLENGCIDRANKSQNVVKQTIKATDLIRVFRFSSENEICGVKWQDFDFER